MESFFGIGLIALGSLGAASFYIPFKKVKNWAWESYWITQGVAAWLVLPWVFAWLLMPKGSLFPILSELPSSSIFLTLFFGALWGVGGLTFGLSIRYLGIALGQSIALGLCAAFGTLLPPIIAGANLFSTTSGILTLIGVAICIVGIVVIGFAGSLKSKSLEQGQKPSSNSEFDLKKGLLIAVLAGIMSACFNFGFQAAKPMEEIALKHGADPLYIKNISLIFILLGGFVTNFIYCTYLNIKNKTYKDYFIVSASTFWSNITFCFLAGLLWFFQFLFFGMGSSKLPLEMSMFAWSILMALNIAISNVWGLVLKEWKGSGSKTIAVLLVGIVILILSTFVVALK